MSQKLTVRAIEKALRTYTGGQVLLSDLALPGFAVLIRRRGRGKLRAMFVCRYGDRRARKTYAVGWFGVLTVEEAREKAIDVLARVAKGEDPVSERRERKRERTFAEWADEYLVEVRERKRSARDDERFLAVAKAEFGRKRLRDVRVGDVRRVLKHYEGRKAAGNRAHSSVRACLQAAWRAGLVPSNVARQLRPPVNEPAPRTRVLAQDEMVRLLQAVGTLRDPCVRAAFYLLVATGARRSEVLAARWEHFDLDAGEWKLPETKSGRPQVIPLPGRVVAMLRTLPRRGVLVVPGRLDPNKNREDLKKSWSVVRKRAALGDVRLHDVRRSVGLAVARKDGLHVASRLLRHSSVTVTEAHYAPLGFDLIAQAAEDYSEVLADVLPFPAAGAGGA